MTHNGASSQNTVLLQCWNKVHMEMHSNNCTFQLVHACWKDLTGPALCIFLWSHIVSFRLNIIHSQCHFMFSEHYTGTLSLLTAYLSPHQILSGEQIKSNEMGRACAMHGRQERCIYGFGVRPEGKSPFGRPRHRWEDNIKMYFQELGWEHKINYLALQRDRLLWMR